jgi:nitrate/nitrite transporter NarK
MLEILSILVGVGSLVCWIFVLVRIFQAGNIGLGILGIICPLFAFIYGWVKSEELNIRQVMLIWTVLIVVGLIINIMLIPGRGATVP